MGGKGEKGAIQGGRSGMSSPTKPIALSNPKFNSAPASSLLVVASPYREHELFAALIVRGSSAPSRGIAIRGKSPISRSGAGTHYVIQVSPVSRVRISRILRQEAHGILRLAIRLQRARTTRDRAHSNLFVASAQDGSQVCQCLRGSAATRFGH